ncbi:hypothetical protein CEXT_177621 [Caerostris extrusa]|uniref:NELF-A N-terminal domain-containing protein n=1 Tax=Caerostris extrusa TaxID=172846 RepID=A0AAV4TMV8_CAEEX|nr:hypothetical protein CEXT_177621 [Caerostris extrusa]
MPKLVRPQLHSSRAFREVADNWQLSTDGGGLGVGEFFRVRRTHVGDDMTVLHIPRRNIDEFKNYLDELFEISVHDNDSWVSMLTELLKFLPYNWTFKFQTKKKTIQSLQKSSMS